MSENEENSRDKRPLVYSGFLERAQSFRGVCGGEGCGGSLEAGFKLKLKEGLVGCSFLLQSFVSRRENSFMACTRERQESTKRR